MSSSPGGSGWWPAGDGRYYPPENHPDPSGGVRLPPPTPATVSRSDRSSGWQWNPGNILLVVGIAGTVIGAFLPWATLGVFSLSGLDKNGAITLALGVVAGVLGITGAIRGGRSLIIVTVITMMLIGAVGLHDSIDVLRAGNELLRMGPSIGRGLLLTVAASFSGIIGSVLVLTKPRFKAGVADTPTIGHGGIEQPGRADHP